MKSQTCWPIALIPLLGACGTTSLLRISQPPPRPEPLVVSPACLAPPVAAGAVDPPPMPEEIVRPAGEPTAQTWRDWMAYVDRRRERAELAGLFFQGKADAEENANNLNSEQLRQCNAWARSQSQ